MAHIPRATVVLSGSRGGEDRLAPQQHAGGGNRRSDQEYSALAGRQVEFVHGNMVPFFRGFDPPGGQRTIDMVGRQTGADSTTEFHQKRETHAFFNVVGNHAHVHGTPNRSEFMQTRRRANVSTYHQNTKPFAAENVGPAVGHDYDNRGHGGFHQAAVQDVARRAMKTSDDLYRTADRAQRSYRIEPTPGQATVTNRGVQASVQRHRPERAVPLTPARNLTTAVSNHLKPAARADIVDRTTHRQSATRFHAGGAAHADAADGEAHDHGLGTARARDTHRASTGETSYVATAVNMLRSMLLPWTDTARPTTKEQLVDNRRVGEVGGGGAQTRRAARPVDPSDVLRTTLKELAVEDVRAGGLGGAGGGAAIRHSVPVYDPDDVARRTVRETQSDSRRQGTVAASHGAHGRRAPPAAPRDAMRTTLRETQIHDERAGGIHAGGGGNALRKVAEARDPNDRMRTTLRETQIHDRREGMLGGAGGGGGGGGSAMRQVGPAQDPNDIARRTLKEVGVDQGREGFVGMRQGQSGPAVDPSDVPNTTMRETSISDARTGPIQSGGGATMRAPVYDANDVMRVTMRETQLHDDARPGGVMGSGGTSGALRQAGPATDASAVARRTIKETQIHGERVGPIGGGAGERQRKAPAFDPADTLKTTIRETQLHDARTGNVQEGGGGLGAAPVYDPNDVLRVTLRETQIHDERAGTIGGGGTAGSSAVRQAGPVVAETAEARVTVKETNLHDSRPGEVRHVRQAGHALDPDGAAPPTTIRDTTNAALHDRGAIKSARGGGGTVRDPNDTARTTVKQTLVQPSRDGSVRAKDGEPGYATNEKVAPPTHREGTSRAHAGHSAQVGDDGGGYEIANAEVGDTNRQETSVAYAGASGQPSRGEKSYQNAYNAKAVEKVLVEARYPKTVDREVDKLPMPATARRNDDELADEDDLQRNTRENAPALYHSEGVVDTTMEVRLLQGRTTRAGDADGDGATGGEGDDAEALNDEDLIIRRAANEVQRRTNALVQPPLAQHMPGDESECRRLDSNDV